MSIRLKLEGFENLLSEIEKAGGSIQRATESAMKQSAQIMEQELKSQMQSAGVPGHLISEMPAPEIETNANRVTARVGYKKGAYDPENPSDGYLVVFLNYGTPERTQHGKVVGRGFIKKARNAARPKIKKAQREVFEKIIGRLQK